MRSRRVDGWYLAECCGWDLAELWMRCSRVLWIRSSRVVRASACQCRSRKSHGFDPSILGHSEIWGAADEEVLNTVHRKKNLLSLPSTPTPAAWTCKLYPFCWNARMSECPASSQSGTGMNKNADAGTSQVPECSGTGLRYRMPECRCRRHRPRYRCSALCININKIDSSA